MGAEAVLNSRDEVLRRIRAAIAEAPADVATIRSEWQELPRNYTRTAALGGT